MRYLLFFLLFISFYASAQQPTGNPTLYNSKWYRYTQYLGVDSALLVGNKDTNWIPRQPAIVLWEHSGVDTAMWLYDRYWRKIGTQAPLYQVSSINQITSIIGTFNAIRFIRNSVGSYQLDITVVQGNPNFDFFTSDPYNTYTQTKSGFFFSSNKMFPTFGNGLIVTGTQNGYSVNGAGNYVFKVSFLFQNKPGGVLSDGLTWAFVGLEWYK